MIHNVPIQDVMTRPGVRIHVAEEFHRVEEKFRMKGIRHLPVVDDNDKVVGVITQRDLYRNIAPRKTPDGSYYDPKALDEFVLSYVMTKNPVTMGPIEPLSKAVESMARNKFGCIPVVDSHGKIIGILTETDVLKFIARNLEKH